MKRCLAEEFERCAQTLLMTIVPILASAPIDNNACERAIRPFAIGRKNWLFMGNVQGARPAAVIYSLIETCKANNIDPYKYLHYVLKKIPTAINLSHLLPQACDIKELEKLYRQ